MSTQRSPAQPHRPLPSGQITTRGAWTFLVLCSLAAFSILLTLNLASVALGVASLGLVAAYPFMKRITWWPQAWLGLTFNWGALLGFSAATAGASAWQTLHGEWMVMTGHWLTFFAAPGRLPNAAAVLLYASGIFWTLGYDTIYAVQDLEDDALAGVKSSARRLGRGVPRGVLVFYGLATALALSTGIQAHLGPSFYILLIGFALHLIWQARALRIDDPQSALTTVPVQSHRRPSSGCRSRFGSSPYHHARRSGADYPGDSGGRLTKPRRLRTARTASSIP